ncbi:MAG: hypothetical protein Q9170_001946 [Blastenia crenularia]
MIRSENDEGIPGELGHIRLAGGDRGQSGTLSRWVLRKAQQHHHDTGAEDTLITVVPDQEIPETTFKYKPRGKDGGNDGAIELEGFLNQLESKISNQDINRWTRAKRAVEVYKPQISKTENLSQMNGIPFLRRCTEWPDFSDLLDNYSVALGFTVAGVLYGGLHALAWNANFISPIEQLLWRTSACMVMGGAPILFAMHHSLHALYDFSVEHFNEFGKIIKFPLVVTALGLGAVIIVAYILARAYLVVECFLQLSHMPAGVYKVPEWSAYLPSIS